MSRCLPRKLRNQRSYNLDVPIASTTAQHSAGRKCCSIQPPSSTRAPISRYRAIFCEMETSDVSTPVSFRWDTAQYTGVYTRGDELGQLTGRSLNRLPPLAP